VSDDKIKEETIMTTGKERYVTTISGGKPDKLPFFVGNYNNFITNYYGITVREYLDKPARTAELMVRFVEEFEFDQFLAAVGYILYGCGPEMGVKWEWAGENFPAAVEGPIKSEQDLEKIQIPDAPTGYFKNYLEMIRLINEAIGDRVFVTASILGPFSTACFLRGVQEVMIDTKLNMTLFEKYMAKCVEISKYFGRNMYNVLKTPMFNEIFLIPELINPRFYYQHIVPYIDKVCHEFNLINSFSAFVGRPDDEASRKAGRILYDALFGTKESLEVIEEALKHVIPGFPFFVAVSGRMLVNWPKDEILDFVKKGVDLVRSHNLYPAISLISVQPPSPESAQDVADKMRRINEFRNSYSL
jgi:hypothetical protein